MGRSPQGRRSRANKLQARVGSETNDHFAKCTIIGCGRPTQRAAKAGLAATLCRKHLLHRQRHGSTWCRSPAAIALRPYFKAAQSFLELHSNETFISAALAALRGAMESAGPVVIATRLRGLPPERRARIALARLREAGVKPERLLAISVAVHALMDEAPQTVHRIKEWRIVAIAKAAHRLASGYHRVWEVTAADGRIHRRTELHVYPRSSGRMLRYLGEWIEKECDWVIDQHLAAVLDLKVSRYGPHPVVPDPLKFAAAADHRGHS